MIVPDIAITSYLGKDKGTRTVRFEYHLQQRRLLRALFGGSYDITTFCSAYTDAELGAMNNLGYKTCQLSDRRMHKWEVHNEILDRVYSAKTPVLVLDDDAVPVQPTEADDVRVDPVGLAKFWMESPDQMGAPLVFFAAHNMLNDTYYKSNKTVFGLAPPKVLGWAMMVRSDLGVLWDKKTTDALFKNRRYTMDDVAFRVKCAAEGKEVLKHNRAFFRSLEPKTGVSTYSKDQNDRRRLMAADEEIIRKLWPAHAPKASRSRVGKSKGLYNG